MSARDAAMEVAYLMAVFSGTNIREYADDEAVKQLIQRGMLDATCELTQKGRMIAEDTHQAAERAATWYESRDCNGGQGGQPGA